MNADTAESEIDAWLAVVREKVGAMRFGSVQILVHEGRVTQVESTEKTRFAGEPPRSLPTAAHRTRSTR